jgi:tetratricopeptide (TPR) repeat protein
MEAHIFQRVTTVAIRRNPTDPVLYTNRSITYQKLWEFNKAIEDCDKAIELNPNFGT